MHQLILQTGRQPSDNNPFLTLEQEIQPRLRMIANAAGDLLPSLAIQLCDTFGANVLPAYGMTECMPISSPPSGSFGPSHASRFLRGCTNKATYQLTHSFAFGADQKFLPFIRVSRGSLHFRVTDLGLTSSRSLRGFQILLLMSHVDVMSRAHL
jgi:acyl-CoA synthetase (AMP-forming)/AMP-acid ligase II